jgi:hypothetical protein
MTRLLMLLALCAGVVGGAVGGAPAAHAQTLRWASQGDAQTMDPHSQNESLTNGMNSQVYERLTARDRQLNIVPGLASEWTQVGPLVWRFKLRPSVRFHDGSAFTADDVVFSLQRAKAPTSQVAVYANAVGTARKIDELTVEITQPRFNPIFLQHLDLLFIMSKSWSEQHKVTKPLSFKDNEESFASFNTNGTGPFMLVRRQPGIRTVYKRNPNWWGRFEGNVQEVQFTPISNDATRLAALVSGEIDLLLDPAPRDVSRLRATPGVQVIEGLENRLIFIGMDQARDTLVYGRSPNGKNPFQDLRVRRAMYQAIDIDAIHKRLMNGLSQPTGGLTPSPLGAGDAPAVRPRRRAQGHGRRRSCGRLRGDAGLPQQPLRQRRGHLPRPGVDVGADQGEGEGQRDAARPVLPQAGALRDQPLPDGLGRRDHRRGDHPDAGLPQRRQAFRRRLLQLRPVEESEVRSTGGRFLDRGRSRQARAADPGCAAGVSRADPRPAPASAGRAMGGAPGREGRAPRRQLAGLRLGHAAEMRGGCP